MSSNPSCMPVAACAGAAILSTTAPASPAALSPIEVTVAHAAAVIPDVVTWQDIQPLTDLGPDTVAAVLTSDVERLRSAHGTFAILANTPWRRRCEKSMREAGLPVPRRGRGDADVPGHLRTFGVTSREMDVLLLIAQGRTNADIAVKLSLSRRTVDTHVRNLPTKTGSTRRTNLTALV